MKKIKTYFELEAGTVITKKQKNDLYFLIIYRKKLKDYTLPKGHVEENESLEEAAIRESFEETGYKVKIKKEIGFFEYKVKEIKNGKESFIIRRVYNFHAGIIGGRADGKNIDKKEGDMEVMWLSYEGGLNQLTYEENKNFIKKVYSEFEIKKCKNFNTLAKNNFKKIIEKIKKT